MKDNKEISVVQVAPPQNVSSGDFYYRILAPGKALSDLESVKTVISITNIHRDKDLFMKDADILLINHVCDPDLLPIIAHRKEKGLVTIFEIGDNINDIKPWNVTYRFWKKPENRALFCKLVSVCDALQTNNLELLKEFGHLNEKQMVLPNQMSILCDEKKGSRDSALTIGWGGSHGHLDDLNLIAPKLIEWFREHPQVKFALMGSEDIFKIFEDIPAEQKTYHKPGSINDYYEFLKTIDIGLAPLKETPYNRCRSDVKYVEYAAFRVVPLLQDLSPYRDSDLPNGTRFLFKEPGELIQILNQLTSGHELRRSVSEKAFEYVKNFRMEKQHEARRLNLYMQLFPGKDKKQQNENGILYPFSGYIPYEETEFEKCLYNGLVYLEDRKSHSVAQGLFQRAEQLLPNNYLPSLFLSGCITSPIKELEKCLEKNPYSLKAYLLLGEEFRKHGDLSSALKCFRDIINKYPDYDLPYHKSMEILIALGMHERADRLKDAIDEINPESSIKSSTSGIKNCSEDPSQVSKNEIYLILPRGNNFGWGICGKYLVKEMAGLAKNVKYVTEPLSLENIGDELDYFLLQRYWVPVQALEEKMIMTKSAIDLGSSPVIQSIQGSNMLPWKIRVKSKKRIGYTFFEETVLTDESIRAAREYFDLVVAGSKWCEDILQQHGLKNTRTIIQGVEPSIFNPFRNEKEYFKDQFVIFSGGKFELRKGQDLVIRAFKHLQQKYKDIILINSWYNHWDFSIQTMSASKHIKFEMIDGGHNKFVNNLLQINGINPKRVITLPPKPNVTMHRIYKNSDIGLFPNRCEGGTNLVLMEYMACGKPAIASFSSGHKDILTNKNAIPIKKMGQIDIHRNGNKIAVWDDPDLDEIIEKLEWAYLNRDKLPEIGRTAGEDLSRLSWKESAKQFHELVKDL